MMKKTTLLGVALWLSACTPSSTDAAPTAAPAAPAAAPAAPAAQSGPVVGPKLSGAPSSVPAALFEVATKHNDEPDPAGMTARLRKRAAEVRAACEKQEADEGACDNAFYLSCSSGEPQEFWLSGFEGHTAIYSTSSPPREFMRVNWIDEGGWKMDAKSCGGPARFEEPWAKAH